MIKLPEGYWLLTDIGPVWNKRAGSLLQLTLKFNQIKLAKGQHFDDLIRMIESGEFVESYEFVKFSERIEKNVILKNVNVSDIEFFDIGDLYNHHGLLYKTYEYNRKITAEFRLTNRVSDKGFLQEGFEAINSVGFNITSHKTSHNLNIKEIHFPGAVLAKHFYLASSELTDFFTNNASSMDSYIDPHSKILTDKKSGENLYYLVKNEQNKLKSNDDYIFLIRALTDQTFNENLYSWRNKLFNDLKNSDKARFFCDFPEISQDKIKIEASFLLLNFDLKTSRKAIITSIDRVYDEFNISEVIAEENTYKKPKKNAVEQPSAPKRIGHKIESSVNFPKEEGGVNEPIELDPNQLHKKMRFLPNYVKNTTFVESNSKREFIIKNHNDITTDKYGDSEDNLVITFGDYHAIRQNQIIQKIEFNDWLIVLNSTFANPLPVATNNNIVNLQVSNITFGLDNEKLEHKNHIISKIKIGSRNICLWKIVDMTRFEHHYYLAELEPHNDKSQPRGVLFFRSRLEEIREFDNNKTQSLLNKVIELSMKGSKAAKWIKGKTYYKLKGQYDTLEARRLNKDKKYDNEELIAKEYVNKITNYIRIKTNAFQSK